MTKTVETTQKTFDPYNATTTSATQKYDIFASKRFLSVVCGKKHGASPVQPFFDMSYFAVEEEGV